MSKKLHVLIVEDDPSLGAATAKYLAHLGHRTTLAPTAAEAFSELSIQHDFDVILLDLRIGSERGETIFDKLQLLRVKWPPVVIASAQPESEMRAAGLRIKTSHLLTKPVTLARIGQTLEKAAA